MIFAARSDSGHPSSPGESRCGVDSSTPPDPVSSATSSGWSAARPRHLSAVDCALVAASRRSRRAEDAPGRGLGMMDDGEHEACSRPRPPGDEVSSRIDQGHRGRILPPCSACQAAVRSPARTAALGSDAASSQGDNRCRRDQAASSHGVKTVRSWSVGYRHACTARSR